MQGDESILARVCAKTEFTVHCLHFVSSSTLHQAFLSLHQVTLGVADPKLGGIIQEALDIQCHSGGVVNEVTRGVRLYFHRMVKGLTAPAAAKAQLGQSNSCLC